MQLWDENDHAVAADRLSNSSPRHSRPQPTSRYLALFRLVWFVLAAAAASYPLATTSPAAGQDSNPAPSRPNIIVFLIDDLGLMDTAVPFLTDEQGSPVKHALNEFYRTPHLERLAGQGTRFSQFYAMSVCSPTRVSLLTGQTSARHRTTQWIDPARRNAGRFDPPDWNWAGLKSDSVTLPRLLQQAGYRTIHCGKGHFGPFDSPGADPTQLGFDLNIGGSAAGQPGSYYGTEDFGNRPGPRVRWGVPSLETFHGQDIFLTEALTREFNTAIREATAAKQPFFGYFAHYAVHAPFQSDSRFTANYPGVPKQLAAFGALVEGVDNSLGQVLVQLEQLGIAEQTLIVFVGDNGTDSPRGDQDAISCAAPLRGKKGTHHEGGMRAPCLISWAKPQPTHPLQRKWPIVPNQMVGQLTAIYDLTPTLLQLAIGSAAQLPPPSDGRDLWPELAGTAPKRAADFLLHFPHEHRSSHFSVLRRGDWKLVYHWRRPAEQRYELFQLALDPSESDNLAAKDPEQLQVMALALRQALAETNAQPPLADDQTTPLEFLLPPNR